MSGTQRVALRIRYDGTGFHGSQLQRGQRTVSGTLTTELSSLLGQDVHLLWAGRTDTGVHADGNVCAFDASLPMPVENLAVMLNNQLPEDLRVIGQWLADPGFHPRFDAKLRTYTYRIWQDLHAPVDRYRYVLEYGGPLDCRLLESVAVRFAGEHGFRSFCRNPEEGDHCICVLEPIEVEQRGAEVSIRIAGNRFLRHMICRIVGALLAFSEGRLSEDDITEALDAGKELKLKPAPARGLTLTRVDYHEQPRDCRN